jgi:hypothetical protein
MESERWNAVMNWSGQADEMRLTPAEMDAGWHFCYDWDELLVGPGMMELSCCHCEFDEPARSNVQRAKDDEIEKHGKQQAEAAANGTLLDLLDF